MTMTSFRAITHGRHCTCGACARQDWTDPDLASCGMHGADCPALYQPWGLAGEVMSEKEYSVVFDEDPDTRFGAFSQLKTAERICESHTTRKTQIEARVVGPWTPCTSS